MSEPWSTQEKYEYVRNAAKTEVDEIITRKSDYK
jgi:hypothetical protein